MNPIDKFLAWLQPPTAASAKPDLLNWLAALSQAWQARPQASPTPAPNSSTPADNTPAATPLPSQAETGQALAALLDLLRSKSS